MTDDLRAIAASAGVIFTRFKPNGNKEVVCWLCYQRWVCSGRNLEHAPQVLHARDHKCPACGCRDLRSRSATDI